MAGRYLIFGIIGLVLIGGVAIAMGIATSDSSDAVAGGAVASMDDLKQREVLFLEEHHVFLVYNDGDPLALSDDAQHVGDRVEFCPSSQMFESPAHGEKFDIRGHYFGGPAQRGLDRYPVRVVGDAVYVDLDQPIQGPERGDPPGANEPEGQFCVFD